MSRLNSLEYEVHVLIAEEGGHDYGGSYHEEDAAEEYHHTLGDVTFVGTVMIYVVEILYAVAGIMVVISALQIYIKMNYHEGDITKSVMILFGGILFMIGASVVMPALFGYQDMNFIF